MSEANLPFSEVDVEQVELPNKPGALGQHLEKLAANGVNRGCIYATTSKGSRRVTVVIAAEATVCKG